MYPGSAGELRSYTNQRKEQLVERIRFWRIVRLPGVVATTPQSLQHGTIRATLAAGYTRQTWCPVLETLKHLRQRPSRAGQALAASCSRRIEYVFRMSAAAELPAETRSTSGPGGVFNHEAASGQRCERGYCPQRHQGQARLLPTCTVYKQTSLVTRRTPHAPRKS